MESSVGHEPAAGNVASLPPLNIARRTIEKTLEWFVPEGGVFEICAFNPRVRKNALWQGFVGGKKGIVAGWYSERFRAADVIGKLDTLETEGIYVTINPCVEAVLARADNRLKAGIDRTTDKEISRIRTILIDIDPKRPAGISSADEEHEFALEHAMHVAGCLTGLGWPDPVIADSGNGGHLTYHVDLPNTAETVELIKSVLKALSEQHQVHRDGITLEIDTKVFNPSRICKVYGTWARKGDSTTARPHRLTRILSVPNVDRIVTVEQLRAVVKEEPPACPVSKGPIARGSPTDRNGGQGGRLDLAAYLSRHGVSVRKTKEHGGAELFVLDRCLFDESHSGGEASIGQAADGKLFYQCFHDSCREHTWADARRIISGTESLAPFMEGGSSGRAPVHIDQDAVLARIQELNGRHAVIMVGGRCHVLNEIWDPVFKRKDITFSRVQDFTTFYANEKIYSYAANGKPTMISIGKAWLESNERRQYKGITFSPGEEIPEHYNLFRGFGCKPKEGDWSLFKAHLFEIICSGDKNLYFYLLAWLAQLVQDPGGKRPGTAIVLRGKRGTGKGCFVSNFGKIIGSHFFHLFSSTHLTGKFNQHLKDVLLVYADEAVWGGDKAAESVLKGMITEEHIAIEPKGKDVFMVRNHVRLIIASNENWVVPAGIEERRFVVLDISEKRIQDHEYFKAIYQQMDSGGREAVLHDLLELDIGSFDLRKIPRTQALADQKIHSMSTAQKFWLEILRRGSLTPDNDEWAGEVQTSALYGQYLEFAKGLGDRYPLIDRQFTKEMKKLCPLVVRTRKIIQAKRLWVLQFPSIWECRDHFETVFELEEDWDDKRY
jgi:hypothetical protein